MNKRAPRTSSPSLPGATIAAHGVAVRNGIVAFRLSPHAPAFKEVRAMAAPLALCAHPHWIARRSDWTDLVAPYLEIEGTIIAYDRNGSDCSWHTFLPAGVQGSSTVERLQNPRWETPERCVVDDLFPKALGVMLTTDVSYAAYRGPAIVLKTAYLIPPNEEWTDALAAQLDAGQPTTACDPISQSDGALRTLMGLALDHIDALQQIFEDTPPHQMMGDEIAMLGQMWLTIAALTADGAPWSVSDADHLDRIRHRASGWDSRGSRILQRRLRKCEYADTWAQAFTPAPIVQAAADRARLQALAVDPVVCPQPSAPVARRM